MAAISNIDIWKPFIGLLALFALIFGGFKGRALVFCVGFALLVNSSVTSSLKKFVDRRRPKQVEPVALFEMVRARQVFLALFTPVTIRYSGERDKDRYCPSFPSEHGTNNAPVALILTFFF